MGGSAPSSQTRPVAAVRNQGTDGRGVDALAQSEIGEFNGSMSETGSCVCKVAVMLHVAICDKAWDRTRDDKEAEATPTYDLATQLFQYAIIACRWACA